MSRKISVDSNYLKSYKTYQSAVAKADEVIEYLNEFNDRESNTFGTSTVYIIAATEDGKFSPVFVRWQGVEMNIIIEKRFKVVS